MNNRRIPFIFITFLLTLTSCVIPGLPSTSAVPPSPTTDMSPIGTMVAATVSAAIAQTEQVVPSPAPTNVLVVIAEASFTPIATSTPTAAPLPTSTPTAAAANQPLALSVLSRQEDRSYVFVDSRAGYEIKLPADWLAVRVNEKEYLDAFSLEEAANAHIQQALLGVQNENPDVLRLFAVDTKPSHIQNEFVSDMRFVLDGGKTISLGSDAELQAIAQKIPESATVFRFEATSVKIVTSASGVQFGVIETKSSFQNTAGVDVPLYQKQVFFNTMGGVQTITLTTLADLTQPLLPAFDAMIETVSLIQG